MTAPQACWLVPHRQRKSKEVGPRGGRRSRTTSGPSRLAGIPLAGPRLTAALRKRRRQAGPRGRSLAASRTGRSFAARRPSSFASTGRRRPPSAARRSPSDSRTPKATPKAIRTIGPSPATWPKAAAPRARSPRQRTPPPITQEGDEEELDTDEEEPDDENSEDGPEDDSAASVKAKLPACRNLDREAKLGGGVDDQTEGGRPKKSLRKAYEADEELDEDEEANFEANIMRDDVGPEGGFDDESYGEDPAQGEDRAQVAAPTAARRWTEDVAVRARAALAWEPRGHPPSNVVRPGEPYNVAARALSALRDDEPYRNPRFVQDNGMESDEEANSKANPPPPSVDGGVWVDDDARGGQSRGQTPPPKCRRRCLTRRRCLVRPPLAKPRGKPDRA